MFTEHRLCIGFGMYWLINPLHSNRCFHSYCYHKYVTISMGLPIVYFKGTQVEFPKLWYISAPEDCFNHSKQYRP